MTWADPRKLVEHADADGYAVGAFNMHSGETAQALVRAAEQAASPVSCRSAARSCRTWECGPPTS